MLHALWKTGVLRAQQEQMYNSTKLIIVLKALSKIGYKNTLNVIDFCLGMSDLLYHMQWKKTFILENEVTFLLL